MKKGTIAIIVAAVLAVCGFGGWMYYQNNLKEMREAGIASLKATANLEDYREAEQGEINKIFEEGEAKILETKEQEVVDGIIKDSEAKIAELKTDAEYRAEEGIAALKATANLKDYREAEQAEIKKIFKDGEAKILDAKEQKEIDDVIKDAEAKISELKTDAEYTAEEEAAAAAAAAASKKSKKKKSGSNGCVGSSKDNFW